MRRAYALAPRIAALVALATVFASWFFTGAVATSSSKLFVVCKIPKTWVCLSWPVHPMKVAEVSIEFYNSDGSHCGLSDLKPIPPHKRFIAVTLFDDEIQRKMYCKTINMREANEMSSLDIESHVRMRRNAVYHPKGRYRGQTQSQYLSIDRGNGNDEGKAEAHSAADSSRAIVSGNSGMGQAQSQTIYDPSCDECLSQSELVAANLSYKPGHDVSRPMLPGRNGVSIQHTFPNGQFNQPGNISGQQLPNSQSPGGSYAGSPGGNFDTLHQPNQPLYPGGSYHKPGGPFDPTRTQSPTGSFITPGSNQGANQPNPPGGYTNQGIPPDKILTRPSQTNEQGIPKMVDGRNFQPSFTNTNQPNSPNNFMKQPGTNIMTNPPYGEGNYNVNNPNKQPSNFGNPEVSASGSNQPQGPRNVMTNQPNGQVLHTPQMPGGGFLINPVINSYPSIPPNGIVSGNGLPGTSKKFNYGVGGTPNQPDSGVNSMLPATSMQPGSSFNYPTSDGGINYPATGDGSARPAFFAQGNGANWPLLSSLLPSNGGGTYFCCVVNPGGQPYNAGSLRIPNANGFIGTGQYPQGSGNLGHSNGPSSNGPFGSGNNGPGLISQNGAYRPETTGQNVAYRPGTTVQNGPFDTRTTGPNGAYGSGNIGQNGVYSPSTTGPGGGVPGTVQGGTYIPGTTGQNGGYRPGITGPNGVYGPGTAGQTGAYGPETTVQNGVYGPGTTGQYGIYGPGTMGQNGANRPGTTGQNGAYRPGTTGQTGALGPGTTIQGGAYGPGSTGQSGAFGPGFNGQNGASVPGPTEQNGGYGPGTTGQTGALGPGTIIQGGAYGPGSTGQSGAFGPGLNGQNGAFVPGSTGQYGAYGPGTTGQTGALGPGTTVQGGVYGPGSTGQTGAFGPGFNGQNGAYGPGTTGQTGVLGPGTTIQGGAYGPGSTGKSGAFGPGFNGQNGASVLGPTEQNGAYGPGTTGQTGALGPGTTIQGGAYGPGSTGQSGAFGPGLNGQNGAFVPGSTGQYGAYGPGTTGQTGALGPGTTVQGGVYGPGSTGQTGAFGPGFNGQNGAYGPGTTGQNTITFPNGPNVPGSLGQNGDYGQGTTAQNMMTSPNGLYSPSTIGQIGGYRPESIGSGNIGHNGAYGSGSTGLNTVTSPNGQYGPGNVPGTAGQNTMTSPSGPYGSGITSPQGGQNNVQYPLDPYGTQNTGLNNGGLDNQINGLTNPHGGIPQNVVDPNSITSSLDDYDSEAQASVTQALNGTNALASSKGGNKKGQAQTQVEGTYTGTGSFSAKAEISDDSKAAQSHVSGSNKGASSSAEGRGRKNKSQASVKLGSETGSILTDSQSSGDMHSSSSQVQGSVKGGMADAQAKGPGSTSSQAQIGFTPYKKEDKEAHDALKTPFQGGGTASAQTSGRMGTAQSQLRGTFKYGITYNGAAQSGSSLDKDAVFSNLIPFDKIDVFDENNKNINVDALSTEKPQDFDKIDVFDENNKNINIDALSTEKPQDTTITYTENYNEISTTVNYSNTLNKLSDHSHSDHHKSIELQNTTTRPPPEDNRRSFQPNYGTNTAADYEYATDKDDVQQEDYDIDDGYGGDGTENGQSEYNNYDDLNRDTEKTHQSLQTKNKKEVEVRQTTGGSTQHIILGSLQNHDANIIQKNSERPDEGKVYKAGERVPGMGGYTIPVGFTGSVRSVASKEKTYVVGSKSSPSQAQTVTLTPGTGKVKYVYPSQYGKNVNSKDLRSLYNSKADDNRYVSVSKSVTRDLDNEDNIRRQYSHTYYTKSSSCGYFTFTCTMVSSAEGKKKVCRPKIPTNPDGSPIRC